MSDTIGLAARLRQAADLIEQHPDLPPPSLHVGGPHGLRVSWHLSIDTADLDAQRRLAQQVVRTIGGKWDKAPSYDGDDLYFRRDLGDLRLLVQVQRDAVCERVVTGTQERVIPAVPAQPERVETVDVVEWRCEPLLAEVVRDA